MTEIYSEKSKRGVEYFIQNDYGQHSTILIAKRFYLAMKEGYDFYKENERVPILSVSEYLREEADKLDIDISKKSNTIQEQITKIDNIVADIKEAIKLRKSLKEIYQIYLEFEKTGLRIKHINELEDLSVSYQ